MYSRLATLLTAVTNSGPGVGSSKATARSAIAKWSGSPRLQRAPERRTSASPACRTSPADSKQASASSSASTASRSRPASRAATAQCSRTSGKAGSCSGVSAFARSSRSKALTPEQDPAFPLVLLHWAVAAREAGRLRDAVEALEEALACFESAGDVRHAGEALVRLSGARWSLGEPDHFAIAERAVALLEPTPGPELVTAVSRVASREYISGSYRAAIETA